MSEGVVQWNIVNLNSRGVRNLNIMGFYLKRPTLNIVPNEQCISVGLVTNSWTGTACVAFTCR